METDPLIAALRSLFARYADRIACAYLYGSTARGEAHAGSDIDVAVLFRETPPASLEGLGLDIAGEIERALGRRADVVVLNRAVPDLVHRILRDGVLLHESDRRMRVAFETRMRAEYFDVVPYLRQYRRSVARRGA
ncbi:MAG: nucleotidyltransferase domain-containing protein [Betaproteobacteria bacterium]|nr:nucleotidyltransferase domain-containing protein [Betaproteobacteria bacterium]